jgi:intracellular septation protein
MQLLLDYIPIIAFVLAYFYEDIFFATIILMATMPAILLIQWALTKKLSRIYAASTLLVLVFGGLTLYLKDQDFMYWKPTVLNWAFALVFLGSQWIGEKTIVERMLGQAASLKSNQWVRLNQIWVAFFIFVGAINLYVFKTYSEPTWVKFKLFGMLGLTIVFVIIQSIWLTMAAQKSEAASTAQGDAEG